MSARPISPGDGDPRHGTANGYRNLRCRCADCRAAMVVRQREARARRKLRIRADDPRHGTANFYWGHGCRCEQCRAAHMVADVRRRRRGVDPALLVVCVSCGNSYLRTVDGTPRRHGCPGLEHGYNAYGAGCRCDVCRAAKRAYVRARYGHQPNRSLMARRYPTLPTLAVPA